MNKQVKIENLKEGIYIPSVDSNWLYKENLENENYEVKEKYLGKLLNCKLDFSHELIQNQTLIENIEIKKIDGKLYTLDVVNVIYNSNYKNKDIELNTKELRDWTYNNGFIFNGKKLTNWKRSSGKAREGQNLFLLDNIKDKCLLWSRMELEFNEEVDIASVRAYESLPLSSVIGSIEIDPSSILVIDDFESVFTWKMSKTYIDDNKKVQTITDANTKESNSIWDGQGLLDSSMFESNDLIKGKGMALLRNRLTKCCVFNCNIQQFYKDYCKENGLDYNTFTVKDIRNNKDILVKDIRLITTPSSLKIKKLYKMATNTDKNTDWLTYYLENCGKVFSVCKTEHKSYLCKEENGQVQHYNRLSYQMLNTIPFKKDDIKNLVKPEIEYVERLKNDNDFFIQEANITQVSENDVENDDVVCNSNIDTITAFTQMYFKNKKFGQTRVFKEYKKTFIDSYIKNLRKGKIRIEGDYCTVCSNPIEMLYSTVNKFTGNSITLKKNEVYCTMFKDGEEIVGFRNPFVCRGNLFNCKNKKDEILETYMNCTSNIVIINSIKYPVLSINQSMDMDSDTMLLTNNSIIVSASKKLDWDVTPIPVNCVENTGSNNKKLTGQNMSDIDHIISQNYIGQDINVSQILNSIYTNSIVNNKMNDVELEELYKNISRCSSFSCVEIDKAKKQFEDLDVQKELDLIKDKYTKKVSQDEINKLNNMIKTIQEEIEKEKENCKRNKVKIKDSVEIVRLQEKLKNYKEELAKCDHRTVKPNFMRFVGDNKTLKQRKKAKSNYFNKLLKELYFRDKEATEENIKIFNTGVAKKNKDKFIKSFNKNDIKTINKEVKEWEDAMYEKIDCNMDWMEEELDNIKKADSNTTLEVIELIKENKHKANEDVVEKVISIIKEINNNIDKIKGLDIEYIERLDRINNIKYAAYLNLKQLQITKAVIYKVLKVCLNKVQFKKNKKTNRINKKVELSSLESLTLELLFKHYPKMLDMFITE